MNNAVFLQVLITGSDLRYRTNLLNTMNSLLSMKMLPILNGNDVVAPPPNDGSEADGLSQASRERERERECR